MKKFFILGVGLFAMSSFANGRIDKEITSPEFTEEVPAQVCCWSAASAALKKKQTQVLMSEAQSTAYYNAFVDGCAEAGGSLSPTCV